MKHARKLTSLLLALVMVFALAVTVAAEGPGSITVVNPKSETTYTAYKIFDVTYDGDNYAYTIGVDGTNPWLLNVRYYAQWPEHGLEEHTVHTAAGDSLFYTTNDKFSPADFAAFLKGKLDEAPTAYKGSKLTKQGDVASVSGLDLGYYFVTSDSGALCNLTTTDPTATIHDKTDIPFEKKADKTNDDVGKTVTYTITGKVPDYTGFDTYTYEITDKMSSGLTFNESSVQVKVGDAVQTASGTTYTLAKGNATDDYTFKVTIYVKNYAVGLPIEVKYTATINENAVAKISTNKAELIYSNDPTDKNKTGKIPSEDVDVYTSKIAIEKVEKLAAGATTTPKKLKGAEFVLYKNVTEAGVDVPRYYKYDKTTQAVTWVEQVVNATTVTTGDNGEASFDGLANGIYYLVETKAPAGYNQLTEAVPVNVNGGTIETALTVTERVENQAGAVLPSTGGMGTTIFYVLGFVLVVGAGVLLVTKKRMSQGEV